MKKKIVTLIALVMLLFPLKALASEEDVYEVETLEEVLIREGVEYDLSNYSDSEDKVTIYLFYGDGCSHCHEFLTFISSIVDEYGEYFELKAYETWSNTDNANLMKKVAKVTNVSADGVPYFIIGEKAYAGYSASYDEEIISGIVDLYNSEDRYDVMDHIGDTSSDGVIVAVIFGILILGVVGLVLYSRKKN